jgi:hypothetical protein
MMARFLEDRKTRTFWMALYRRVAASIASKETPGPPAAT